MRGEIITALLLSCSYALVLADGYGGGYGGGTPMIISSGGGKKNGKWKLKAKGKGMQNIYTYGGGGGGGGGEEYHEDYHQNEVYYYPVPIYTPYHAHDSYESHKEEDDHKVSIIPINLDGGGYGGGYGGYGGGGGKMDYGTLLKLLSLTGGGSYH